jgi:hypothetical protein
VTDGPTARDAGTRTVAAVAVAVSLAARHGLPVDDPVVLHDGVNVVVRPGRAPVVARVATLTRLLRPGTTTFRRDVELAGALAARGAPVVSPTDLMPPGPHEHGGTVVSFWAYVDVLPDRPTPSQAAAAFAELQEALGELPPSGRPLDVPLDDLGAFIDRAEGWGVAADLPQSLSDRLDDLRPGLVVGEQRQLHGDAYPGNLLATPHGWRWTDMEDSCSGPLAWDLACLRATSRLDGRAALDALPDAPSDEELAPWLALRRLHGAAWAIVHAQGHPQFAEEAHRHLADVLAAEPR